MFAYWNLVLIHADLRHRRVPNTLIVAGFAGQLLAAGRLAGSWLDASAALGRLGHGAGRLFCAFLFLPVWARRKMGAGDVKAIAILGLLLGFAPLMVTLVGASLLAGLHALAYC